LIVQATSCGRSPLIEIIRPVSISSTKTACAPGQATGITARSARKAPKAGSGGGGNASGDGRVAINTGCRAWAKGAGAAEALEPPPAGASSFLRTARDLKLDDPADFAPNTDAYLCGETPDASDTSAMQRQS